MKIAYVVGEKLDKSHGVAKKIFNQISAWIENGHDVKLFYFSNADLNSIFENIPVEHIKYKNRINFILCKNNAAIKEFDPDIVYFRYYLFSRTFSEILKNYKSIIEINSNDVEESKNTFSFAQRMFLLATRNEILRKADGFITVTEELKGLVTKYSRNMKCIPNAIDGKPSFFGKNINAKEKNIVFIGSPNQVWHGMDKIVYMAKQFTNINFHIIGMEDVNCKLPNIKYYGFLERAEYLHIFEKCDVAIGTLALHRKNMDEASPLKVREYLKYGLPIIIGYKDSDFLQQDKYDFILQLPNTETNIEDNIDLLKEFVENAYNTSVNPSDIKHIFFEMKEKERLQFFEDTLKGFK